MAAVPVTNSPVMGLQVDLKPTEYKGSRKRKVCEFTHSLIFFSQRKVSSEENIFSFFILGLRTKD